VFDAHRLEQGENADQNKKSTRLSFSTLNDLVRKRDPLLQAVLYENMITLTSTAIPLIVSRKIVFLFFP
jgi:hypothetical protein